MRRFASTDCILSGVRPKPSSASSSFFVSHARFSSIPTRHEKSNVSTQNGRPQHEEDDLGFKDWSEVNSEEKTVETAIGALPISPLLDPAWQNARQRGQPKAKPVHEKFNRFQRKLYRNPYANMLAQPVRMCQLTRARLPRPFLQSFGLGRKPESEEIWWIPSDYTFKNRAQPIPNKASKQPHEEGEANAEAVDAEEATACRKRKIKAAFDAATTITKGKHGEQNDEELNMSVIDAENEENEEVQREPSTEGVSPSRKTGKFWSPVSVLARQDLLASFHEKSSKYHGGHMRFAGNPSVGSLAHSATWRKDMHIVIPEKLRLDVATHLAYLAEISSAETRSYLYPIPLKNEAFDLEAIRKKSTNRWALLQVRSSEVKEQKEDSTATTPAPTTPPSFGPFTYFRDSESPHCTLPMYHLPSLLGPDLVEALTLKVPDIFGPNEWLLLYGAKSSGLAGKIWRLQSYVADYESVRQTETIGRGEKTGKQN